VAETSTLVTFVASALGVALVPQGVEQVRIPGVRYLPLRPDLTVPLLLARRDRTNEAVAARVAGGAGPAGVRDDPMGWLPVAAAATAGCGLVSAIVVAVFIKETKGAEPTP
jgi:hypothetical protein